MICVSVMFRPSRISDLPFLAIARPAVQARQSKINPRRATSPSNDVFTRG
jgi:hypothetical protein